FQHLPMFGELGEVVLLVRVGRKIVQFVAVEAVEHVLVRAAPDDALRVAQSLTVELRERLWLGPAISGNGFRARFTLVASQHGAQVAAMAPELLANQQAGDGPAQVEEADGLLDDSAGRDPRAAHDQRDAIRLLERGYPFEEQPVRTQVIAVIRREHHHGVSRLAAELQRLQYPTELII